MPSCALPDPAASRSAWLREGITRWNFLGPPAVFKTARFRNKTTCPEYGRMVHVGLSSSSHSTVLNLTPRLMKHSSCHLIHSSYIHMQACIWFTKCMHVAHEHMAAACSFEVSQISEDRIGCISQSILTHACMHSLAWHQNHECPYLKPTLGQSVSESSRAS